jgi:hypothetical protein
MKKVKLRESGTESHKFYLNIPSQKAVTLKTETPCAADPAAPAQLMTAACLVSGVRGCGRPGVSVSVQATLVRRSSAARQACSEHLGRCCIVHSCTCQQQGHEPRR